MANYKIIEVEGIGPAYADKLTKEGITNTDKLLEACKTKKMRKELAEKTTISEEKILKFANMVDLFRIQGIGPDFSELLEASGVDTVPELAQRNAENLAKKMQQINEEKNLTRRLPAQKEVEKWIAHAKELPRCLEYSH